MLIRFLRQKVKDFKNNTQGIVLPIFGVVAFTVATIAVVAIDVNQANNIEKELQALADKSVQNALSKSGLNNDGSNMGDRCTDFYRSNFVGNPKFATVHQDDFECMAWLNNNATQWKLKTTVTIRTPFSGLSGQEYKRTIISTATHNDVKHEIVIVASVAGTMCGNIKKNGSTFGIKKAVKKYKFNVDLNGKISLSTATASDPLNSQQCQKMSFVKAGVESLYMQIRYLQDLRIGFVPYTHTVKFPGYDSNLSFSSINNNIPPSLQASKLIEGRSVNATPEDMSIYTNLTRDPNDSDYIPEIVPLGQSQVGVMSTTGIHHFHNNIKGALDTINTTPDTPAWARMDLGMHVAGLMLDPDSKDYFQDHDVSSFDDSKRVEENLANYGGTGTAVKKAKVKKFIVLISDGMNAGAVYTNQPSENFDNNYFYQYEPYNKHLLDVCNVLKKPDTNNVQIFTIIVQGDEDDELSQDVENIMALCSSDVKYKNNINYDFTSNDKKCIDIEDGNSDKEYCYKAKSAAQLNIILNIIGKKINNVVMQQ